MKEKSKRTVHPSTEAELQKLARDFLCHKVDFAQVRQIKLITDITGRSYTLKRFIDRVRCYSGVVTHAPKGSYIGERAHSSKLAFVLLSLTLERFGVETLYELHCRLVDRLKSEKLGLTWVRLDVMRVVKEVAAAVPVVRQGHDVLWHEVSALLPGWQICWSINSCAMKRISASTCKMRGSIVCTTVPLVDPQVCC